MRAFDCTRACWSGQRGGGTHTIAIFAYLLAFCRRPCAALMWRHHSRRVSKRGGDLEAAAAAAAAAATADDGTTAGDGGGDLLGGALGEVGRR